MCEDQAHSESLGLALFTIHSGLLPVKLMLEIDKGLDYRRRGCFILRIENGWRASSPKMSLRCGNSPFLSSLHASK